MNKQRMFELVTEWVGLSPAEVFHADDGKTILAFFPKLPAEVCKALSTAERRKQNRSEREMQLDVFDRLGQLIANATVAPANVIGFGKGGRKAPNYDGQHRLMSGARTGLGLRNVLLHLDLPAEVMDLWDHGRGRALKEALRRMGWKNHVASAAAVRLSYLYEHGKITLAETSRLSLGQTVMTIPDVAAYAQTIRDEMTMHVSRAVTGEGDRLPVIPASLLAFLTFTLSRLPGAGCHVEVLRSVFLHGASEDPAYPMCANHPFVAVRELLRESAAVPTGTPGRRSFRTQHVIAEVFRAWNMAMVGQFVTGRVWQPKQVDAKNFPVPMAPKMAA